MCDFSGEAAVYGSVIRRVYEDFRKFNPPLVATNPKKSKSWFFLGGGGNNIIASHHAWGHHIWVLRCVVWSLYAQMTPSNLAVNIIWETIAAIVTHKLEVLLWHDEMASKY